MDKIFFVGGLSSGKGGLETVLIKVNSLLENHFETKLILFDYKKKVDKSWLKNLNYKIIKTHFYFRILNKISYIFYLKQIIKKEKPLFIICFDAKGCLFSYKATRKIENKPTLISWCHFSFDIFSDKEKKYIAKADYHLTIAEEIKTQMINFGINKNIISTIYNPIEKKIITIPPTKNNENINFIYVGRIQYEDQKNIKDIFYALSNITYKYKFHLIGSGKDEIRLKELSTELNISNNIIFHGWKTDPWGYIYKNIKNIDALLLSSNYEGFGMVLVEAISYGIFCISSDCSTGPKEIISNKNGLFYENNNISDFVKKLNYFYEENIKNNLNQKEIQSSIKYLYEDIYIKKLVKTLKNIK